MQKTFIKERIKNCMQHLIIKYVYFYETAKLYYSFIYILPQIFFIHSFYNRISYYLEKERISIFSNVLTIKINHSKKLTNTP